MPGMKLDFLKNAAQRRGSGKNMPLRELEALITFGRPEQRAKAVDKILPAVYNLSLDKKTHHIIISLLTHCENMDRVKLLYFVRRKLLDMSTSPAGNLVVQSMIERVPARQRREIAEAFVLNVDPEEVCNLCRHRFGNRVISKLLEYPDTAEVVMEHLRPYLATISTNEFGMHVLSHYVEKVEGGCADVVKLFFPTAAEANLQDDADDGEKEAVSKTAEGEASAALDKAVKAIFDSVDDPKVLSALLAHPFCPGTVKDAICAHLCEYGAGYLTAGLEKDAANEEAQKENFDLPDFGTNQKAKDADAPAPEKPKHTHIFIALFEHGDDTQRGELWEALKSSPEALRAITTVKGGVQVGAAVARFVEQSRAFLLKQLAAEKGKEGALSIADIAADSQRTILLRAIIQLDAGMLKKADRKLLSDKAVELGKVPTASPVLQMLLEADASGDFAAAVIKSIKGEAVELAKDQNASFLLSALLRHAKEESRQELVEVLTPYYVEHLQECLALLPPCTVLQTLLAYAPDEMVVELVDQFLNNAASEENPLETLKEAKQQRREDLQLVDDSGKPLSARESRYINRRKHYEVLTNALISYATHHIATYVIRGLLLETRSRQLEEQRKALMNELKPHVFDLAVSPWAGRIVLEAMMSVGSAELAGAMKNVIFLHAEEWLSGISEERKQKGNGLDATQRSILKRGNAAANEDEGSSDNKNNHQRGAPPNKKFRKERR